MHSEVQLSSSVQGGTFAATLGVHMGAESCEEQAIPDSTHPISFLVPDVGNISPTLSLGSRSITNSNKTLPLPFPSHRKPTRTRPPGNKQEIPTQLTGDKPLRGNNHTSPARGCSRPTTLAPALHQRLFPKRPTAPPSMDGMHVCCLKALEAHQLHSTTTVSITGMLVISPFCPVLVLYRMSMPVQKDV